MAGSRSESERGTLHIVRRFLAVAFVVGSLGTAAELVLLEHTEDLWQWTPLILIISSTAMFVVGGLWASKTVVRITRALLILVVASAGLGTFFHLKGNVEFEKEMYPSMAGFELAWESLRGATPSLAPGAMALLGVVGLIYCYRHPVFQSGDG